MKTIKVVAAVICIKWLPADVALISCIKNNMRVQEMLTRKVSVEKLNEEKTKKL